MTNHSITVFIADDHPIFRKGLEEVIDMEKQFHVVGSVGDGQSAIEGIIREKPSIAVIDIEMPKLNGLEVIRHIHENELPVRCMVLTMYQEEAIFDQAMELGVRGYLLKDSAISDILRGLEVISRGNYYISPSLTSQTLKSHPFVQSTTQRLGLDKLTMAERQVLSLIANSYSSRRIAEELFLSTRTVENHRYNIVQKLGLSGSYSLLRFALDNKSSL